MMKHWKTFLMAGVLCLAAIVFVLVTMVQRNVRQPDVTKANFERIRFGMSVEEVNKILGPPFPVVLPALCLELNGEIAGSKCWISREGQITVCYTEGHGVFRRTWSGKDGISVMEDEG
jgi:hypothetical protein